MSQVIVTDDRFKKERARSRMQEAQIDTNGPFARWRLPPMPGEKLVRAAAVVVLPILALWGLMMIAVLAAVGLVFHLVCRLLAKDSR